MSFFDNNLLKKVNIESKTTHQCCTCKIVKSKSYLASPSIQNDTNFDNINNTPYEVYVPSIDNEW